MNDTPKRVDEFSTGDYAALDALPVETPSRDFADRVLARAELDVAAPWAKQRLPTLGRRARIAIAAGTGVAAIVVAALVSTMGAESVGRRESVARETISLGDRAVAVAEANAALEWRLGARGADEVVQSRGNVFYRVEKGDGFVVRTPAGTVRVVGTCFRVEVNDMTNRKAALTGASVGAVLAATAIVALYEGRVTATTNAGALTLEPGQRAVLAHDSAPRVLAQAAVGAGAGAGADIRSTADAGAAAMREKKLVAEIARLQREIDVIRAGGAPPMSPTRESVRSAFDKIKERGAFAYGTEEVREIVKALQALGKEGLDLISERLAAEPQAAARFVAAALLEGLGDPTAVASLGEALRRDKDVMVRRMASHAISTLQAPDGISALEDAMQRDPDVGVQINSAYGVGKVGRLTGVERLAAIYHDRGVDPSVKLSVLGALMDIAHPSTAQIFRNALRTSADVSTQLVAIKALEKMKDANALADLEWVIANANIESVTAAATKARNAIKSGSVRR